MSKPKEKEKSKKELNEKKEREQGFFPFFYLLYSEFFASRLQHLPSRSQCRKGQFPTQARKGSKIQKKRKPRRGQGP